MLVAKPSQAGADVLTEGVLRMYMDGMGYGVHEDLCVCLSCHHGTRLWGCKQRNLLYGVDDTTSGRGVCKDENSSTKNESLSRYR